MYAAKDYPQFPIDPDLGVCALFVSAPRKHLAYIKLILESYEGVGVARTEQPFYGDDRALVVFLLVPDFFWVADTVVRHLENDAGLRKEDVSDEIRMRLRDNLLAELAELAD
jgi:hypothetical protein